MYDGLQLSMTIINDQNKLFTVNTVDTVDTVDQCDTSQRSAISTTRTSISSPNKENKDNKNGRMPTLEVRIPNLCLSLSLAKEPLSH
jgi:hypothetical protein